MWELIIKQIIIIIIGQSISSGLWHNDFRSSGCGFDSGHYQVTTPDNFFSVHTHVPLSPSSIIWYRPRGGDAL